MGGCGSTSAIKVPREKRYRRAIKLYQVTEVKSLTNLINRNKCFESGESPLTLAAQEGHEAVVQSLVVSGADVNKLDNNGRGALHIAVQLNDEETVEILLAAHANPNKYDTSNVTPLHLASENGNRNLVSKLLRAGANVNECERGFVPLVCAVAHGNANCAEELLRRGADPNVFDTRGNTVLHLAVRHGNAPCVRLLLEYKADPGLPSHDMTSLVCLACLTGCAENVKALIDVIGLEPRTCRQDEPPLTIAATAVGSADCLDVLLSKGIDPELGDRRGQTALQVAVHSVIDTSKSAFYAKYFSNLYRQYSKFDVGEMSQENSTRCVMSLVTGGADVSKMWEKFPLLFPPSKGITFEQMVACEVLVQCFGFKTLPSLVLRRFVTRLLAIREHGLLKLMYSAGVDPTWTDESNMGMSVEGTDRDLYRWIKKLRTNPRTLKDLCRKVIRGCVSTNVLTLVRRLPVLCEDMKDYVCIMDTAHYSVGIDLPGSDNNNHGDVAPDNAESDQAAVNVQEQEAATAPVTASTATDNKVVETSSESPEAKPETEEHKQETTEEQKQETTEEHRETIIDDVAAAVRVMTEEPIMTEEPAADTGPDNTEDKRLTHNHVTSEKNPNIVESEETPRDQNKIDVHNTNVISYNDTPPPVDYNLIDFDTIPTMSTFPEDIDDINLPVDHIMKVACEMLKNPTVIDQVDEVNGTLANEILANGRVAVEEAFKDKELFLDDLVITEEVDHTRVTNGDKKEIVT